MNRFSHTCSYRSIIRLHKQSAAKVSSSSCSLKVAQQQHNFAIKVADNFDLNKDTIHGEKNIHIMNQIIIQTVENDEIGVNVTDSLNELRDTVSDKLELCAITELPETGQL
ncbi:unnamed protein product [Didymodactylos carnosus]|uniref:Uncharacterized protein n=1 Tax=Didymodactylos carnosus TaxID=1234261 RepID=A0A815PEJ1_9BILA|nr:unnamed protein product [Didymodactylos carnosus]CAF1447921.1 unnamed protein product [Didymodactylos carnosus]CAF3697527.1 unnamed protein product [Didymodactylos carnosus]CAF4322143.1 unnamed protein product [Didymodactylos carnosus]